MPPKYGIDSYSDEFFTDIGDGYYVKPRPGIPTNPFNTVFDAGEDLAKIRALTGDEIGDFDYSNVSPFYGRDSINQAAMDVFKTGFNNRNSGILSQVDSRFPLYDDFTVAEKGDDLEENAVTVDELGNLKQPFGFKDFLRTMLGFAIPGAGLFTGDKSALEGIKSLNQRLRNTDFGRSKNLMDYLDMKKYGGYQGREDAIARNMAQARGIQKKIDSGEFGTASAQDKARGQMPSRTASAPKRSFSSNYSEAQRARKF